MSWLKRNGKEVLELIRPRSSADGATLRWSMFRDDEWFLLTSGACKGCPMKPLTLANSVEARAEERIPSHKSCSQHFNYLAN